MQPDDPELTLLQAVALYELGRYAEAGSLLLKILPHDESNLPRCFFAYCLLRMGSVEIAEEILKKISIEGPYDYYLHYHLGLCRLIQGDLRESRRYFGIAYRDFFIDSREYCFEYLIQKVRAAVERLKTGAKTQ
jgi:tetratricopeptide (TPR) repeat protein